MNEDQFDKDIMNYVDGVAMEVTNEDAYGQARDLKTVVSDLKKLPLQNVSQESDDRFYRFIDEQNANIKSDLSLKRWFPYVMAAASVVILFFVFTDYEGLENEYKALDSNPEKLSFIYNLNEKQLRTEDIDWLKAELTNKISPNIKVTIVDLLGNYASRLDQEFYHNLQYESIPSVQMSLLNTLENSNGNGDGFTNELLAFSQRRDLDNTVMQKVEQILSNQ